MVPDASRVGWFTVQFALQVPQASVLRSSHCSLGAFTTPSPHTPPVSDSELPQVALQRVQLAWPYGHEVSVVGLPSSHTSVPFWMLSPQYGPTRASSAVQVALHTLQLAVP